MAQTRTAKGTNASKTNGTALTVSGVAATAGTALVVGIAWEDNTQGDKPVIKWGNRELRYIVDSEQQRGDTIVRLYRTRIKNSKTKDVTATWANAVDARAMFVTEITEGSRKDVVAGRGESSTTSPATSTPAAAPDSTVANTLQIGAFASLGPTSDPAATAGAGHSLGQRVGTTGGGAGSNITLQETFEILTAVGAVRSTLTLTTARAVASTVCAFRAVQTYTVRATSHIPWKVNGMSNRVQFIVQDETPTDVFVVELPVEVFEILTDQQVTDYIAAAAQWYTDVIESENDREDPDSTIETRLATFDNDTVTL